LKLSPEVSGPHATKYISKSHISREIRNPTTTLTKRKDIKGTSTGNISYDNCLRFLRNIEAFKSLRYLGWYLDPINKHVVGLRPTQSFYLVWLDFGNFQCSTKHHHQPWLTAKKNLNSHQNQSQLLHQSIPPGFTIHFKYGV
jgi:bifunctional pyridoxal-dependent enzyme with beta-cystathionase and maltose regulon repressor activities